MPPAPGGHPRKGCAVDGRAAPRGPLGVRGRILSRADVACESQGRRVANGTAAADLFEEFFARVSASEVTQGAGPIFPLD
eukprot:2993752-Lingulodinium_polyedra.AAC.1